MVKTLLLCLLLGGCACKPVPCVPQIVEVPVIVKAPEPQTFELPVLPISMLTENATPDLIIKAYVASVLMLKGEVQARDQALAPYRTIPTLVPNLK